MKKEFITGEFCRTIDDRYRLTLPNEFDKVFKPDAGKCVIAKEGPGCLSLWDETVWKSNLDQRVKMVRDRWQLGDLGRNTPDLQRFARLLSTRHRDVQLAGRARLMLPEGFREFLAVEPQKDVMVIGAGICIEIWHPKKWMDYLENDISHFGTLLETLSH
ncbi:MAG: division/cell wall cluster transcriptional repressor MraZ [Planctomycetaceae bacterium]|jgi:MraZ protein|nr:division/cell wall cluster transcriptional repressor MraZ [Planctomycetaceae bacterium]